MVDDVLLISSFAFVSAFSLTARDAVECEDTIVEALLFTGESAKGS